MKTTPLMPEATEREVITSQTTIFLHHLGTEPPLLLIHSFPQTHLMWRDVVPYLTRQFTETNRPAIIEFRGQAYFFYHNGGLKYGGSHRRSVCVDICTTIPTGR